MRFPRWYLSITFALAFSLSAAGPVIAQTGAGFGAYVKTGFPVGSRPDNGQVNFDLHETFVTANSRNEVRGYVRDNHSSIEMGTYARSTNTGHRSNNFDAGRVTAAFASQYFSYVTNPDDTHSLPAPTNINFVWHISGSVGGVMPGSPDPGTSDFQSLLQFNVLDWSGNALRSLHVSSYKGFPDPVWYLYDGNTNLLAQGSWTGNLDLFVPVAMGTTGVTAEMMSWADAGGSATATTDFSGTAVLDVMAPAGYTVELASGHRFVGASTALVPEPGAAVLFLPALGVLALFKRRRCS